MMEAGTFEWRFLTQPTVILGGMMAAFDLTLGQVWSLATTGKFAWAQYKSGGIIIHNSATQDILNKTGLKESMAFATGPFVFAPDGVSAATLRHEFGHVQQYHEHGGWGQVRQWLSGYDVELDADLRALTVAYPGSYDEAYLIYGEQLFTLMLLNEATGY